MAVCQHLAKHLLVGQPIRSGLDYYLESKPVIGGVYEYIKADLHCHLVPQCSIHLI